MEVLLHLLVLALDHAHLLPVPPPPPQPAVCQLTLPTDATATRVQDVPDPVVAALLLARPRHVEPLDPVDPDSEGKHVPLCTGEQVRTDWSETRQAMSRRWLRDAGHKSHLDLPTRALADGKGVMLARQDLGGGRILAFVATGVDTSEAPAGTVWGGLALLRLEGRTLLAEAVGGFRTELDAQPQFRTLRVADRWLWIRTTGESGTGGGGGGTDLEVLTVWKGRIVTAGHVPADTWDDLGQEWHLEAHGELAPTADGLHLTVRTQREPLQDAPRHAKGHERTREFDLVLKRGELVRKDGRKLPDFLE